MRAAISSGELDRLANSGAERRLSLTAGDLARAVEARHVVAGAPGELRVVARFSRGAEGLPVVELRCDGELTLCCQRCLGSMLFPVLLEASLTLVADDSAVESLARPFEAAVLGEHGLSLAVLAEDELLGCLPLAPMHEPGDCESAPLAPPEAQRSRRPFADLARMMRDDDADRH